MGRYKQTTHRCVLQKFFETLNSAKFYNIYLVQQVTCEEKFPNVEICLHVQHDLLSPYKRIPFVCDKLPSVVISTWTLFVVAYFVFVIQTHLKFFVFAQIFLIAFRLFTSTMSNSSYINDVELEDEHWAVRENRDKVASCDISLV